MLQNFTKKKKKKKYLKNSGFKGFTKLKLLNIMSNTIVITFANDTAPNTVKYGWN